jgi:hypothetical protein
VSSLDFAEVRSKNGRSSEPLQAAGCWERVLAALSCLQSLNCSTTYASSPQLDVTTYHSWRRRHTCADAELLYEAKYGDRSENGGKMSREQYRALRRKIGGTGESILREA